MFRIPKQMGRWIVIAVAIGLLCSSEALAKKPPKPGGGGGGNKPGYNIVQLDDVDGAYIRGRAYDINNLGDVVGYVEDPATSERRAAYWDVSGSGGSIQSQLSSLTGGYTVGYWAAGINDLGEISGIGLDSYGQEVGLYWANAGAAPLTLPPLSENVRSSASAISNDGVIVGYSDSQAVAWRINRADGEPSVWGPLALPSLDDSSYALASAINNNDVDGFASIVGHSREVGQQTSAVAWTVQSRPDGTLSVDPVPRIVEADDAMALGVNDSGMISGEAGREAMVWTEVGSQTLHRAKDASAASAQDINNNGTIVGWGGLGRAAGSEAVVWPSAAEKMILLNKYVRPQSPFGFLIEARAVNEMGEVVGFGITGPYPGTGEGAFLAIPNTAPDSRDGVAFGSVPEPSAFVLSTLAIMGVGLGLRWRRGG